MHFFARRRYGKKIGAIDLWKSCHLSRLGRPLHFKGIAFEGSWIAIACEGPGADFFSAFVVDSAERQEVAAGHEAGFFLKFALRCGEFVFAGIYFTLGDEPRALIFFLPERPTEMHQKNFQCAIFVSVHQQTRAIFRHGVSETASGATAR